MKVIQVLSRRWKLLVLPLALAAMATGCAGYYGYDEPAGYAYYDDYGPYYGYYGPDIYLYGGGTWGPHFHGYHYYHRGLFAGRDFHEHHAVGGFGGRTFGGTGHGFSHGGGHVGSAGHGSHGHGGDRH